MPKKSDAPKDKGGRPSKYTEEILNEICSRLSKGEPLAQICRDDHMPSDGTVRAWMKAQPEVSDAIARAREAGFDEIALDCLRIADDTGGDTKFLSDGQGSTKEAANTEWISRSKLRVETRLKLLAKWDPKRYGEKLEIEQNTTIRDLSDAAIDARLAELDAKRRAANAATDEG
jgi:hypothetical protein